MLDNAKISSHRVSVESNLRLIDFSRFISWLRIEMAVFRIILRYGLAAIHLSHAHRADGIHIFNSTTVGGRNAAIRKTGAKD